MLRNKMLPIEKMIYLDRELERLSKSIEYRFDDEDLPEKLGLYVEYVDSNQLAKDTEAELRPPNCNKYNGVIRILDEFKKSKFSYMHEIIHYLRDVGAGKKVQHVYARKKTGRTETEDEQEVNYMTAHAIISNKDIDGYLEKYDNSKPKMDELKLVDDLCSKYGVSQRMVVRTIKEARKRNRYMRNLAVKHSKL